MAANGVAVAAWLEGCAEDWVFQERWGREQAYLEALERLAGAAREREEPAAAFFQTIIDAMATAWEPEERAEYERYLTLARGQVPESVFAAAGAGGRARSLAEAIDLALDRS